MILGIYHCNNAVNKIQDDMDNMDENEDKVVDSKCKVEDVLDEVDET